MFRVIIKENSQIVVNKSYESYNDAIDGIFEIFDDYRKCNKKIDFDIIRRGLYNIKLRLYFDIYDRSIFKLITAKIYNEID